MSRLSTVVLYLALLMIIGVSSAAIQTFDTPFGKAQLDVPYGYELKDTSGGSSLQFVLSGSEKPIISLVFDGIDVWGSDLEKYASMHFGEGHAYEETTTSDNHKMHFYNINDYGSVRDFNGIIDHVQDKGAIVMVFGNSETPTYGVTYGWDNIVRFTKEEFLSICKSFAFV
jgi:hypothetical protein